MTSNAKSSIFLLTLTISEEVNMNQKHVALRVSSIISLVIMLVLANTTGSKAQEQQEEKSLYERLGGVYSIATVVDDFIERLFW